MLGRMQLFRNRRLVWLIAAAAAAIAAVTVTQAFASDTSGGTVYACVAKTTGIVRIVQSGTVCSRAEYATSWSVTGPAGAPGAKGDKGDKGDTGATGPQGPAGAAAPDPTPRAKVVGTVTLTPYPDTSPTSSESGATVTDATSTAPGTTSDGSMTFDIYDFSDSFQQAVNLGSQSNGAGAGKVTFQPITMTKAADHSSPQLFTWLASGKPLKSAEIQLYAKDGKVAETVECNLVVLKSLTTSNSGAATDSLFEQLGIDCGEIDETVSSSGGDTSSGGWNQVTNTPPSTLP